MIGSREEFLNTLTGKEKLGRWVLLRHYTKERSEYWDATKYEAVGGPAWKFVDSTKLCYSCPQSLSIGGSGGSQQSEVGYVLGEKEEYYFEHDTEIEEEDDIYEFAENSDPDSDAPTVAYTDSDSGIGLSEKFKVKKVVKYRGFKGRIEYVLAICERSVTR